MLITILFFCAVGAFVGTLAGLLGVGGGIIMVPALIFLLPGLGVGDMVLSQMAVGTSLACICIISISSSRAHHRRGGVRWSIVLSMVPGLVVGALMGAWVAHFLSSLMLQRIVGVAAVLLGMKMFVGTRPVAHRDVPSRRGLGAVGVVIGSLSSLIGIGGGSMTVPYLSWCNVEMKQAVGTSAACGIAIAWAGVVGFMVTGWGVAHTGVASVGYVSLPAFGAITVASIVFVPVGASLAYRLPAKTLKRVFSVLLVVVGINMLLG